MPEFYRQVENSTAHRPVRDTICTQVLTDEKLFPLLLNIALATDDTNHHKACWIMELVCDAKPELLAARLDEFCRTLPHYRHEGAIRSISKIALICVQRHIKTKNFLSAGQLKQITETCFDWLITDTKVASKAYAMRALYLLGKDDEWIHPELKVILQRGFSEHSAAYKSAAREILSKI